MISYSMGVSASLRALRFEGMWVSHPFFLDLVRLVWFSSIPSSGPGVLVQKLKLLKVTLRK